MSSRNQVIWGFVFTVLIFLIANLVGTITDLSSTFLSGSFMTHLTMLLLSIILIWVMMKQNLSFQIALPKFKEIFAPFFIGVLITIAVNILMNIITTLAGGKITAHPLLQQMNALQTFLFIFILASVAEELLFRGFLQNSLKSLNRNSIKVFNLRLSLPVIIGAFTFGLVHLILISTGVDYLFLVRIVLFTTILGIAAGYYQEKYNNTTHAILVHMGGNLPAIPGAAIINLQ